MDALLPPLLAAFLAEWGDRTQLLAMMLALRFNGSPRVLVGIALAALLNNLFAAFGGQLIHQVINFRAITLMAALALLFAGLGAMLPQKPPKLAGHAGDAVIWPSFFAFAVLSFGDKTQFLTMTLAARANSVVLAALGATLGVVLANAPAVLLGHRMPAMLPLRSIRIAGATLLTAAGIVALVSVLRLV